MQLNRYILILFSIFTGCLASFVCRAQLGFSFNIPKPKQFEERQLPSEKSEQKKFTLSRRFFQNTTTHYNYFFNANNKLNEIITRAKEIHRDDYNELLSFYNYDLDVTARDSVQLDSVMYKATSGIVLHDLRNDWVDNLYLLWGAAYYLRKDFDSAYLTFQFINYAFAPKEKGGYYQFIGSGKDNNNAFSISTKEKENLPKKIFSRPPSRNEAFIWQIRTFLAWGQYPEAASLIATLKGDPVFPERLQTDLEEVQALYFYKQKQWDSSAFHLSKALGNATNSQEKARWEFLTAQMYERMGDDTLAQSYYERAVNQTVDPVMAVYARLYAIKVNKSGGDNYIDKNIAELVRMARHERFSDYRDIIYYMAGEMELERNNIEGARQMLLKATQFDNGNPTQRNRAYLKLAELAYADRDYRQAYSFYDSLRFNDPALKNRDAITHRKEILGKLAMQLDIISRQDSLQRIAAMPEDERKEFVKKILKQLQKKQGIKEDETGLNSGFGSTAGTDIFGSSSSKGEWYFDNTALRTKGASDFKAIWGNRPNVDNWRRMQAVVNQKSNSRNAVSNNNQGNNQVTNQAEPLNFDNLYSKLPLTDALLKISNDSIQNALFELGKIYAEDIEDCREVINTYEELRTRYPGFGKMDEVLFHLYYCYNNAGDVSKTAQIKTEMNSNFPTSNLTTIVSTGKDPKLERKTVATTTYENIYDQFIQGNFEEAVAQKKTADSLYGETYWTPQLLYIESVYYIRECGDDSAAITELKKITNKYPSSPLASKASTLIDVLKRRKQIEEELTNLKIEPREEPKRPVDTIASRPMIVKTDTAAVYRPVIKGFKPDSVVKKNMKPILAFTFDPRAPHYVMIILNKVDVVFGNETKNAFARYNSETFYNKTFEISAVPLDADNKLVLISPFDNAQAAIDYIQQTKPKAASEIIPWLKADRYSFSIISAPNLEILKSNPDLVSYKLFLDQNLPGKF